MEKGLKTKIKETSTNELQSFITQGKSILIKNQDKKTECYIHLNVGSKDDFNQWVLLLNGNEFFCKEIIFKLPVRTCTIKHTEEDKTTIVKHSIYCEANEINFENNIAVIS
jgi:hypothetical protein